MSITATSSSPIVVKCPECEEETLELSRQIASNGSYQIGWFCQQCDRWMHRDPSPGLWLPRRKVEEFLAGRGLTVADLPVPRDLSADAPRCDVRGCEDPGEYHHWAPQAWMDRFGPDWPAYPGGYLCRKHHTLWHEIVTPSLRGHKP